jgi:hypothetical protein
VWVIVVYHTQDWIRQSGADQAPVQNPAGPVTARRQLAGIAVRLHQGRGSVQERGGWGRSMYSATAMEVKPRSHLSLEM